MFINYDFNAELSNKNEKLTQEKRALIKACRKILERGDAVPQWVLDVLQAAVTETVSE